MEKAENSVIIKFDFAGEQQVDNIVKINGLVNARYLVSIIDNLGLDANPRSSKTGDVTEAIQRTIAYNPRLFPFMTKGILLAASKYERLERNRIKFSVVDKQVEGILDGGHNTLAIGLYILTKAMEYYGEKVPKGAKTWDQFKEIWTKHRNLVEGYLTDSLKDNKINFLQFYIPVELVVPRDPEDENCVYSFRNDLYDICEARNHNHELDLSTKDNQRGYYDYLKSALENHNPQIAKRVRYKTNTAGEVKVLDLVALSWIALNLIDPVTDEKNSSKQVGPIAASRIFTSKGACATQYDRLMGSPDVTIESDDNYQRQLCNSQIESALNVAVQLPELYDYIYENFPKLYNASSGSYGNITSVKNINEGRKEKKAPFCGKKIETLSPEGFIIPLVYGLQSLMKSEVNSNGERIISWRTAPMPYLVNNLPQIVSEYKDVVVGFDYDPVKVGRSNLSYTTALRLFKD